EQQVAGDLADRAQLARVAVALAQQARDRVAAPVAELREIDRDDLEAREVGRDRGRILVAVEPYAQTAGEREQVRTPLGPEPERNDDVAALRHGRERPVRVALKQPPAVRAGAPLLDQ